MRCARLLLPVLVAVAACGRGGIDPGAPLPTYEEREVLFVEPDHLHDWMEAGNGEEVVFIDNRAQFAFEQKRIQGARLIPSENIPTVIGTLPVNKWLIMYCT